MIIETRYRDISAEELRALHPHRTLGENATWEKELRGRPITLQTLPVNEDECGPWYRVQSGPRPGDLVCVHIVEIGD